MLEHGTIPNVIFNNKDFKGMMVFHIYVYIGYDLTRKRRIYSHIKTFSNLFCCFFWNWGSTGARGGVFGREIRGTILIFEVCQSIGKSYCSISGMNTKS
jgi:hypothetical protein